MATADDLIVAAGPKKGIEFGKLDLEYLKKVVLRNPGDDRLKSYARAKVALAEVKGIQGIPTAAAVDATGASAAPETKAEDTFVPLQKTKQDNDKIEPAHSPGRMGLSPALWLAWLRKLLARVEWRVLYILFSIWTLMIIRPTLAAATGRSVAQLLKSTLNTFVIGFQNFLNELWEDVHADPATDIVSSIRHELEKNALTAGANVSIVVNAPRHGLLHMLTLLSDNFVSAVFGMLFSVFMRNRGAGA